MADTPDNENRNNDTKISPIQSRMARAAIGWGVRDLARETGVSADTIARLERGEELKLVTLQRIRDVFEAAGVEFIPENGGGVGVRLKKRAG